MIDRFELAMAQRQIRELREGILEYYCLVCDVSIKPTNVLFDLRARELCPYCDDQLCVVCA